MPSIQDSLLNMEKSFDVVVKGGSATRKENEDG